MASCWRCHAEITEPSLQQTAERPEPINVAAAAAAAAVVSPASPQAEAHRSEHFAPPEVANEARGYVRELEQHELKQEDGRSTTEAMPTAPERVAPATTVSHAPSFDLPRLRFRPGRVIFVGLLSGLLVAVGLLAVEGMWARYRYPNPSRVSLVEQRFAQFDFSMEVPSAWDVEPAGEAVSFTDPDRPDDRGIRVTRMDEPFEDARSSVDGSNLSRFPSYVRLTSSNDERVGGRSAILREFIGNDLQYRQWVVANGGSGSLQIESWFHPAEADETQILDQRIIESFSVL